jgi:hypothetical protein
VISLFCLLSVFIPRQRAETSQFSDDVFQNIDNTINFFPGIVSPERKSNRAVSSLVIAADAENDMAAFERPAETG